MALLERLYVVPLAIVLLHIVLDPLEINHDCGQFLMAGQILVDGGLPFVDAIDPNPPLIMYVSAIPALLAKVLPLPVGMIFNLLVLLAALGSTQALRRLLRHAELGLTRPEIAFTTLLWATATLSIDVNHNLGQRDYLFMLAFHPYVVLRWLRWEGAGLSRPLAVALGLATGLTVCFRPSLMLLVAVPELVHALRRRRLRPVLAPETQALACAVLAYAGHFLLMPEIVRVEFFQRWVPLLATGYSAFDSPITYLLRGRAVLFTLACAASTLLLQDITRPFAGDGFWRLARDHGLVVFLGAVIFVTGGKNWTYRLHPAFGGAVLVLALGLVALLRRLAAPPPTSRWRVPVVVGVGAFLGLVGVWGLPSLKLILAPEVAADRLAISIRKHSRPGDRILVLTTGVTPEHPALLQTGRRLATRYLNFFPIPIFVAAPDPAAERRFLDEIREDVRREPPSMIVLVRMPIPTMPKRSAIERYFEERGLLPELLVGYYPVDLELRPYSTYVRAAPPGAGRAR